MSTIAPPHRGPRRLDIALALLLALTGLTWLLVDGALPASSLTAAVFAVTTAKALVVMTTFMELWRGPRWAMFSLAALFGGITATLAGLLG